LKQIFAKSVTNTLQQISSRIKREQVISEFYRSRDINNAISKLQPVELQDDLRQEVFLVLCEMDESRLLQMYNDGFLKYFIVRTIMNMMKSNTSRFYNTFRKGFQELTNHETVRIDEYDEELLMKLENGLSVLHWYEKEIFRLYSQNGQNILALSRDTKIPYRSLVKTIKKVKTLLKYKIRNHEHH
jgi:hypothetical protein